MKKWEHKFDSWKTENTTKNHSRGMNKNIGRSKNVGSPPKRKLFISNWKKKIEWFNADQSVINDLFLNEKLFSSSILLFPALSSQYKHRHFLHFSFPQQKYHVDMNKNKNIRMKGKFRHTIKINCNQFELNWILCSITFRFFSLNTHVLTFSIRLHFPISQWN